jgi:di/tricarboxylate transporter
MTTEQITLFAILCALFALLAWGRWRYDVVAFLALLAAVVSGVVPAGEAFAGFGHPATITVAAILVLSRSLATTGATDWIARAVRPATGSTAAHIGLLSSLAAAMSSFMNNVGTLGLLMPVALQSARKAKRSPAVILMPLSFGAILGGLVTLIGTPPNIIVANYRGEVAGAPFAMFDFTPVGATTALAGVLFVALVGWRLVPVAARKRAVSAELFDIEHYVTEARVPKNSAAVGRTLGELDEASKDIDALLVAQIRGERRYRPAAEVPIQAGDVLVIEAGPEDMDKFTNAFGLKLGRGKKDTKAPLGDASSTLVEAVVAPRSRLEGQTVGSQRLIARHGFTLLAVARQGRPHRGRLKAFRFGIGDVLLLHGEAERVPDALAAFGCLPLAARGLSLGQRGKAWQLIAIFAAAIAAASLGLLPIPIALSLAVALTVLAGLLPVRELYEGVDWPVIILLGALIPVGAALADTGATKLIAGLIHDLTAGRSPILVLVLLMVVTMTLSDVLNNAATAVVMAPIGAGIAERLGASPDPFLMAVAIGASCAFLTPIGHQNNALIMGPGGYRFWDYWRMGLPLEALIVAVSTPMILLVWPL